MPRSRKTKLPPVPQSPVNFRAEILKNLWIRPEGKDTPSLQYMLSSQDYGKFQKLSAEPGHRGVQVTLFTLAPGNSASGTPVWFLVSFPAYLRPADCGASCFCAAEWSTEPFNGMSA